MSVVTNISAYRFAALDDLPHLRERLTLACRAWGLKGTILLSAEGINLFVAGPAGEVEKLLTLLRAVPGLEGLEPKISESREQPFRRMLVKIKKEIIAFGVPGIDPARAPAPRLSARELKQWLDEGRPVTLLDTRNDYEVSLGTFRQAVPIGIQHFRDFPSAVANLALKTQPIVTFCTGGIRCEKAAPYLMQQGFEQVFQLDGGILKYFEECGNEHYDGECFVFDQRVGLSGDLDESGHGLCFVCQSLLTPEEFNDPRTVEGVSCPHCYRSPAEQQARALAEHRIGLRRATTPLPGKQPSDSFRPLNIDVHHDGFALLDFLCDVFREIPRADWLARCEAGDIVDAGHSPVPASHLVGAGELYFTRERLPSEPDVNAEIEILYEDTAIIVLNKPAPLPMRPSGPYKRNTLQWILGEVYAPQKPRPANRLDANASGIVVFSRTSTFGKSLQPQFDQGKAEACYLARVIGHPPEDFFTCTTVVGRTEFEVLKRFPDGSALLSVKGRTDQIRDQLRQLGWPIVGDGPTLEIEDGNLNLHAWQVTFSHPQHGRRVMFEAPTPEWA